MFRNTLLFLLFNIASASPILSQNLDVRILKSINPDNPNSVYWERTSQSAYWIAGGITVGSYLYGLTTKNETAKQNGIEALITLGINRVMTTVFKELTDRRRPYEKYPADIQVLSYSSSSSFPSGHASLAFATATSISLEYRKWYIVAPTFLWAGSVAYSRIYLGQHYPSDVLAGAVVGIAGAYASHWLNKKLFRKWN